MRRLSVAAMALTFILSLAMSAGAAQALVVNMSGVGPVGVAPLPGSNLVKAGIPVVTSSGACADPALPSDLALVPSSAGLCWNHGPVLHRPETFALTWDAHRQYWAGTRGYVEQFLRDVADGSNTFTSPFAITPQYTDNTQPNPLATPTYSGMTPLNSYPLGRAENASLYGGGCIDYGTIACNFTNSTVTATGHPYPSTCSSTCTVSDADLQGELTAMINQTGLVGRIQSGYSPLIVLLLPKGVVTCVDSAGKLCSANGTSTARFCSYHSHLKVGTTDFAYVVQPWTAGTGCDEPDLPAQQDNPAIDAGTRLVSPLSASQIAALVNPDVNNGWIAENGAEIDDNGGCRPFGQKADQVTVGSSGQNPYFLQREFNNASVLESDPYAPSCAPGVALAPAFVVPSPIDQGDQVWLDGSVTNSTLMVTNTRYAWNFGDGQTAIGPSVVHTFASGGSYPVTLTVTDRGGNVRTLTQTVTVLGPDGKPVPPATQNVGLHARVQLMPQGLGAMLRGGMAMVLSSNESADGIATLSISGKDARRAHLKVGRAATVVIARGTVSGIKNGTMRLQLRLSGAIATRLRRLGHLTVTLRLSLFAAGGNHASVDVAGRY